MKSNVKTNNKPLGFAAAVRELGDSWAYSVRLKGISAHTLWIAERHDAEFMRVLEKIPMRQPHSLSGI